MSASTQKKCFKKQARCFHLVFNKSVLPKIEEFRKFLETKPLRYSLARKGLNKAKEEHIHVYVNFSKPVQLTSKTCLGAHIAKCRGTAEQNIKYIESHHPDLIWEIGERPKGNENINESWDKFIEDIHNGCVDKDSKMYARYHTYADRRMAELKEHRDYEGDLKDKNLWIWGPSRTGKTYWARHFSDEKKYVKPINKWWDGYDGQKVVIIEDIDPDSCKHLAHHMKLWADRYPFTAALKGSSTVVSPAQYNLIVTSNYCIDECFDGKDLVPIHERFDEWNVREPLPNLPN